MIRVTVPSVSAEVILKSKSGRSMIKNDIPITSKNIEEFRPSQQIIESATKYLERSGFTVTLNGITLTIEGERSLYERIFKVRLAVDKSGATGRTNVRSDKELTIPPELSDIAEGVVFVPQPEYFP